MRNVVNTLHIYEKRALHLEKYKTHWPARSFFVHKLTMEQTQYSRGPSEYFITNF
jgi:hypothetical protein